MQNTRNQNSKRIKPFHLSYSATTGADILWLHRFQKTNLETFDLASLGDKFDVILVDPVREAAARSLFAPP